jgi:hypothetical protein
LSARSRLPPPGPLPDSHALRARALAASWRRDRTVHRRRLAWRWLQWAFVRYGLPALVGATALVLLLAQVTRWPDFSGTLQAAAPAAVPQAGPPASPAPAPESASSATASPASAEADRPQALRLETALGTGSRRPVATDAPPLSPGEPPDPDIRLQPDDYLHSKEP